MRAIILNFNRPTHVSLIQNNGEHEKRDNISTGFSRVHSLMLYQKYLSSGASG